MRASADQGRRLQAVAGVLALYVAPRQLAQLLIHNRRQPVERTWVSLAPGSEQQAYLPAKWPSSPHLVAEPCITHYSLIIAHKGGRVAAKRELAQPVPITTAAKRANVSQGRQTLGAEDRQPHSL